MLEDGYFVCVKKTGLKQTDILTALLADGACFEGDVGKLSFLHGATVPKEIPVSPAFIAKDGDGLTITPGGWMPFCPVLYGAEGLLPDPPTLLTIGGLGSHRTLSTDEILESATATHSMISNSKGKRWTHMACVSPISNLSGKDVDALFSIFSHVHEDDRQKYVIYMINTIHGAASVALNEIKISKEKRLTFNLMQTVAPNCENVKLDELQAVFAPYYSEHGVGGKSTLTTDKAYTDMLGDIPSHSLSMFIALGEQVAAPIIPFMASTCASDVFKLFPGGIDGVDNGTDMLELFRALALGVPGKTTTASQSMDPRKFNMVPPQDPHEISRPGTDIATFICLATLYTAGVQDGGHLSECEPRHLHIMNMLERMRTLRGKCLVDGDRTDKTILLLRELIDDVHAPTLYTYMDTASAINRLEYENVTVGKPEQRKTLKSLAEKTYQRPLVTMPGVHPLTRLWLITGGDFVMYAHLVRAMERDILRFRADSQLNMEATLTTQLPCSCENQTSCIHRTIHDWCSYTQVHIPGADNVSLHMPTITSSSQAYKKRFRKRTAAGILKEQEKMFHDSFFQGTLRCQSPYDIVCSPVGNTNLKPMEGTSAMYENEKTNDKTEQYKHYKSISAIINGILKQVSMGIEEENVALYETGMAAGEKAMKVTMATMGEKEVNTLLFGTSPHVLLNNGKASWEIGERAPLYAFSNSGIRYKSLHAEVIAVAQGAANAFLDKIISIMRFTRKECLQVKNNSPSPLVADPMWKNLLRCDPNLNQYDGMNVPLLTSTMINILRPVVSVQKAQGLLFQQAGFLKEFPYYDRTKLDDVFGNGGNVHYGMDGKFVTVQSQIGLFTHSNPPACVPCVWKGTFNQRMTISVLRVKGMCKGKDAPQPWKNKGSKQNRNYNPAGATEHPLSEQKQAPEMLNVEEDSTMTKMRQVLSKPFVFEEDDDDEIAYADGVGEIENVLQWKEAQPSSWMEGVVLASIFNLLEKHPLMSKVSFIVRQALQGLPKWRYVCKALDLMDTVYSPRGFFIPGDNKQGLAVFKYMLVYMMTCHTFGVETLHSKPTYTTCGFLGPCMKIGRAMNFVLNYDLLCPTDCPIITTGMDYSLYSSNLQSKLYGGPCMKKVNVRDGGMLRSMPPIFCEMSKAPYFILMTPCVPFPDRESEGRKQAMLGVLSFEEILSNLHSEKMTNLLAKACGYDNIRCIASVEASELRAKLCCLSISQKEAEIITQLLMEKVTTSIDESKMDDDISMAWGENYEIADVQEKHGLGMHTDVHDLINKYE